MQVGEVDDIAVARPGRGCCRALRRAPCPSAIWSTRFFSRPIQTATPTAIARGQRDQHPAADAVVALNRPSEMPLFCGVGEVEDRQQYS